MKSVLYFQSSINASNNSGLDGVRRYAKAAGRRVTSYTTRDAEEIAKLLAMVP